RPPSWCCTASSWSRGAASSSRAAAASSRRLWSVCTVGPLSRARRTCASPSARCTRARSASSSSTARCASAELIAAKGLSSVAGGDPCHLRLPSRLRMASLRPYVSGPHGRDPQVEGEGTGEGCREGRGEGGGEAQGGGKGSREGCSGCSRRPEEGEGGQAQGEAQGLGSGRQGRRRQPLQRRGLQAGLSRQGLALLPLQEVAPGRAAAPPLQNMQQGRVPAEGGPA